MSERQETNTNLRFLSLDRAVFDGMASALLDKIDKDDEITRIANIESLDEALSELRKCGISDQNMTDYLDKWEQARQEDFNNRRRVD